MNPTGVEKQYYDQLFASVDKDGTGVLPGADAFPFFTTSNLPQQTLGEIWAIADPENNGFLTREGWYKAARIIGWIQKGNHTQADAALASKPGPYPTFTGYPPPPAKQGALSANVTGGGGAFPPLTPADRTKFTRIFVGCGPSNGFVSGDKARDVFLKSQLNYDKLGQIWNLADTQQRGALDLTDFIIGMYLIQSCMANPSLVLPATLPPGTYEAASGGRPAPTSPSHQPGSPIQRQLTGSLQPQLTGQSLTAAAAPTPPRSSTMTPTTGSKMYPSAGDANPPWDVTPDSKAASDRFFAQLDSQNKGVIEGDVAVPFMLQSQLDEGTLASIWDLADIRQEGKLDPDEFAVAMHLINSKLAGKDIPTTLPTSLIPPRLRSQVGAAASQPQQQGASKDLFDLFGDDEAAPATPALAAPAFLPQPPSRRSTTDTSRQIQPPSQAPPQPKPQQSLPQPFSTPSFQTPQPSGDLLGEDSTETSSAALDRSADMGNKKNELANTNRHLAQLEKTKGELEQNAASTSTQLATLESELSTARMKHETETKAVSELRIRVGEQTAALKKLEADVISAESDLNAMRLEKQELEQALLRDKEEVRGLQKRMSELEDEKKGLKLLLEKIKKEARQQKGMVTIAKKQVSTAEGARDAVQKEVHDAENETAEPEAKVVSPTRALSPEATGNSRGSMNPFDRLNRTTSASSDHSHLAGAAAFGGAAVGSTALAAAGAHALHSETPEHSEAQAPEIAQRDAPAPGPGGNDDVDPFGVPTNANDFAQQGQNTFDSEFDDSFAAPTPPTVPSAQAPASDFDTAFADFDTGLQGFPAGNETPKNGEPIEPPPLSTPQFAFNPSLRPEAERTISTQAVAPSSAPQSAPATPPADHAADSSDEEEGPEDLEGPKRDYSRSMSPSGNVPAGPGLSGLGTAPVMTQSSALSPNATGASIHAASPPHPGSPPSHSRSPPPIHPRSPPIHPGSPPIHPGTPQHDEGQKHRRSAPPPPTSRHSSGHPSVAGPVAAAAAAPVLATQFSEHGQDTQPPAQSGGAEHFQPAQSGGAEHFQPAQSGGAEHFQPAPAELDPCGAPTGAASTDQSGAPQQSGASTGPFDAPRQPGATDPFGVRDGVPQPPPSGAAHQMDPFGAPQQPGATDPFGVRDGVPQPPPGGAAHQMDPFGAPVTSSTNQTNATPNDPFGTSFSGAPSTGTPISPTAGLPGGFPNDNVAQQSQFDDDEFDFAGFSNQPANNNNNAGGNNNNDNIASGNNNNNNFAGGNNNNFAGSNNNSFAGGNNNNNFASSAFDDEFANFDDEFDKPASQVQTNSDKSYEVVSAPQGLDEWGMPKAAAPAAAPNSLSFDDAFGGEFSPTAGPSEQSAAPVAQSSQQASQQEVQYQPPAGPPPSAPPLPERPDLPQPDDLEDVKKLCGMGFSRTLVVEALDANGYSFQKALNVLLDTK